jgi:hypothetical protein
MNETTYTPGLFQAIANEVVKGFGEQYLLAIKGSGLTVMFSTPAIEHALTKATAQVRDEIGVLAAEYQTGNFQNQNVIFADGCRGLSDVNGVLVEFSVRKLRDDAYRVLFSRVDATLAYTGIVDRLSKLEESLRALQSNKDPV